MNRAPKRVVRQRARRIKKATKAKATAKDYLQNALVILVIAVILAAALYLTQS